MAGFVDLVQRAQPALLGGGCTLRATEGVDWKWVSDEFLDEAGDPIDFTGITGTCVVLTDYQGTEVVEIDFDGNADGTFELSKAEADTVGLALGEKLGRKCVFDFWMTDGSVKVQGWGVVNSYFYINPGV